VTNYAVPSATLQGLWSEWIDLHTVLSMGLPNSLQEAAVPFLSAASNVECKSTITFVGKV